jgi:5,5'-dehydrodivanillate O-demethylase
MLTKEENELLTRIGPGTPAGELLRRYWHPIAVAKELTPENPTKFVRVLGEDLVLFLDKSGRAGLIADHCMHRSASMLYGRVEERGIACAYHGWLYDTQGNCLETPAEPVDSKFYLTVKIKAYPVKKFVGLYWAYMGPSPAPEMPKYDLWVRQDGVRKVDVYPRLDCNWFQAMENSMDPAHLQILHQNAGGRQASNTTRGLTDDVERFDFYEVPYGLIKKRTYKSGLIDEHPVIFPNILRVSNASQIRVPMDDTHTNIFFVRFVPNEFAGNGHTNGSPADEDPEVAYLEPFKTPADGQHPFMRMRMDLVLAQDHMAWETQGPIADRTIERLATTDRGIVLLRDVMKREIDKVSRGEDPMGVVRDPNAPVIDTHLSESIKEMIETRGAGFLELLPEIALQAR